MAKISLAKKPLKVTVGRGPHVFTAQRRLFTAVTHGVRPMALGTVILVYKSTGSDGL